MRSLIVLLALTLLLQLLVAPAWAGAKPQIGVCFHITEPLYVLELREQDRRDLEQRVAGSLAKLLAERTAFLETRVLQREQCERESDDPLLLTVELNKDAVTAEGTVYDVVFHLRLQGGDADPDRKIQWLFRKKGTVFNVDYTVPAFHLLITEKLREGDDEHLVRELFSQLPIATKAELFKSAGPLEALGWELVEHSHDDLCMSNRSELAVLTRFGSDEDSIEELVFARVTKRGGDQWRSGKIRGKVTSDDNDEDIRAALEELARDQVKALGVYVRKYVLLRSCVSITPQESGL